MSSDGNSSFAIVTIATRNYVHFARALATSVRTHMPGTPFFTCIVDGQAADREGETSFQTILGEDLNIANWKRMTFQYGPQELAVALKPVVIRHLTKEGFSRVVFLDADTLLYASLSHLEQLLDCSPIVVSPHILNPKQFKYDLNSIRGLYSTGVFNTGFVAVKSSDEADDFLDWWETACSNNCVMDVYNGLYIDQRWIDAAPALFERLQIDRHPGLNVAYWNLHERPLRIAEGNQYMIGEYPLLLFHFSGIQPNNPTILSKFSPSNTSDIYPLACRLARDYIFELDQCGRSECTQRPYGYSKLSDGQPICTSWREAIRTDHPSLRGITDPFDVASHPGLKKQLRNAGRESMTFRRDWRIHLYDGIADRVPLANRFLSWCTQAYLDRRAR